MRPSLGQLARVETVALYTVTCSTDMPSKGQISSARAVPQCPDLNPHALFRDKGHNSAEFGASVMDYSALS